MGGFTALAQELSNTHAHRLGFLPLGQERFTIAQVRLDRGGYEVGTGRYFGRDVPLWRITAWSPDWKQSVEVGMLRGRDRDAILRYGRDEYHHHYCDAVRAVLEGWHSANRYRQEVLEAVGPRTDRWIDIGSDSCWEEHGGLWGKRNPDGLWTVFRIVNTREWGPDAPAQHGQYCVTRFEIDPSQCTDGARRSCDMSEDACEVEIVAGMSWYGEYQDRAEVCGNSHAKLFAQLGANPPRSIARQGGAL